MEKKKKILAVASLGGHWIQLLRIAKPLEDKYEVIYVGTHEKCATMVEDARFYKTIDFSRWDMWRVIPSLFRAFRILRKEHTCAIVTTGAAPGLIFIMIGRLLAITTIWIDSVANAEEPSLSGKIASRFATKCYTQWPEIANERFFYAGNIFDL